jgi:cell division protein FtsB
MSEPEQGFTQSVVDAMINELQTSMQQTINNLMQRGVTLRSTLAQLESAVAAQEQAIAALTEENNALKALAEPSPEPPQPPAVN